MVLICCFSPQGDVQTMNLVPEPIVGVTFAGKTTGRKAWLQVHIPVRHNTEDRLAPNPERKGGKGQDDDAESELSEGMQHDGMEVKAWRWLSQGILLLMSLSSFDLLLFRISSRSCWYSS